MNVGTSSVKYNRNTSPSPPAVIATKGKATPLPHYIYYVKEKIWQSPALSTDSGICQARPLNIVPWFFFSLFHLLFEQFTLLFTFGAMLSEFLEVKGRVLVQAEIQFYGETYDFERLYCGKHVLQCRFRKLRQLYHVS